ncbi:porin [uncultured Cardiobacterium sp.]|uniref:porin n=1 Tax=uncultured Cardiobacterium sp. TaxID=417619 RepID=UPI002632B378|nr:porin [uncultured Cardiobacterium sp.]
MCRQWIPVTFILPAAVGGIVFAADKDKANDSGSSVTLYGAVSQGMVITDRNKEEKTRVDYLSDHVRIGIRGEEKLGNGMRAFFNIYLTHKESKDGSAGLNGLREGYVGLKGNFGKLTLGRQTTAWKTYMGKSVFDDAAIGLARPGKVIRYDLDNIAGSGFKFAVDGILDGSHEVIKNGKTRAFNAYDAAVGYKGHGLDTSLGYQRTSVDAIETELGGKTNEIMGASIAYTPFANKDKKQSLELAFDYQHHAGFGDFFATSADYSFGAQKLRAGWEMLDYDKEKTWQQFHLGHRYYFSKHTFTEVKGAYRTQGGEHSYLTKILLRHDF